jgi:hypothetical protein
VLETYRCVPCGIVCSSKNDLIDHQNGKRHLKGLTLYEARKFNEKKRVLVEFSKAQVRNHGAILTILYICFGR